MNSSNTKTRVSRGANGSYSRENKNEWAIIYLVNINLRVCYLGGHLDLTLIKVTGLSSGIAWTHFRISRKPSYNGAEKPAAAATATSAPEESIMNPPGESNYRSGGERPIVRPLFGADQPHINIV